MHAGDKGVGEEEEEVRGGEKRNGQRRTPQLALEGDEIGGGWEGVGFLDFFF